MALSSTLSNVLIEGNTFEAGFASSNGTSTTQYLYDRIIDTSADSKIVSNNLSGINNNTVSGAMINLVSSSSNITGNTFVRASNSLFAYINGSGSSYSSITDNFFDKTTIDGSSTTLVKGIPSSSVVDKNVNQTFITHVLWASKPSDNLGYGLLKTESGTNPVVVDQTRGIFYNSSYLQIEFTTGTSIFVDNLTNLNNIIPVGAKIVSVAFTVTSIASANALVFTEISPGDNYIQASLYYSDDTPGTKNSTPTIGNAQLNATLGPTTGGSLTATIDNTSDYENWTIVPNRQLIIEYGFFFENTTISSAFKAINFNNVIVTYRY